MNQTTMKQRTRRSHGMMSKQTAAAMILALASGALFSPSAASGQLTSASPSALATANNYTALARGFTTIALNPAGLAMPGNPGFSLTLIPVEAKAGLSAMTLSEVATYDNQKIPDAVKRQWLQSVVEDDGFELRGGLSATGFALTVGPVGFQVSNVGSARVNLSPDAFELLMFGNAGLTGTPRDMSLEGTSGTSWDATTAAVALGIPLPDIQGGNFAVGATLKYTVGHIGATVTDAGSVVRADPFGVDLAFSSLTPRSFDFDSLKNNGTGVGMDIGFAWEGSTWVFSAALQNVFHTFEWDVTAFDLGVGDIVLDGQSFEANFSEVPAAGATSPLLSEFLAQRFEPAINMGIAYRQSEKLALTADYRHETGEALVVGERSKIGLGVEWLVIPFLPVRAGVSSVSGGGIQLGVGLGLKLGPVNFSGAYLTEQSSAGEFRAASFALSFGQ